MAVLSGANATRKPIIRVVVEQATGRKGWHWVQLTRNGAIGAQSPKNYDTKALAKRAGQRQVDLLNGGLTHFGINPFSASEAARQAPYAVLVVVDA